MVRIYAEQKNIMNINSTSINPLKPSGNFSCRFKKCYSYESLRNKSALIGLRAHIQQFSCVACRHPEPRIYGAVTVVKVTLEMRVDHVAP